MGDHDHGISLEAARDEVRACFAPVADTEEVPLEAARGRVLAEDVVSRVDVPGFDNSAMDGFALAASSLAPRRPRSSCHIVIALSRVLGSY